MFCFLLSLKIRLPHLFVKLLYGIHGVAELAADSLIDLKPFTKGEFDFDFAIDRTCKLAGNSGAFLISEEFPQSHSTSTIPTDDPCAADAGPDENWIISESDRVRLVRFAQMEQDE
jgi:hypothetical protein